MIRISFDSKALVDELRTTKEKVREMIVGTLNYAGREAINAQRQTAYPQSYRDQSGNLRSSTGFVVSAGGEIRTEGEFAPVQGNNPTEKSLSPTEASEEGLKVAHEAASTNPDYPTLDLVAGMNYASYVADKGYDVLSTARLIAEESIREQLNELSKK